MSRPRHACRARRSPPSCGHAPYVTPSSPVSELRPRLLGGDEGRPHAGGPDAWRDLAPEIVRQRLVIEGVPARPVDDAQVRAYLAALSRELDMVPLNVPVTHRSDRYGWGGCVPREAAGG